MSFRLSNNCGGLSCRPFVAGALVTLILIQALEVVDLASQFSPFHTSVACTTSVEGESKGGNGVGGTTQLGSTLDKISGTKQGGSYKKTNLSTCPPNTQKNKNLFKSQSGEDAHLLEYFGNKCNGRYVEMGALDGVRYSNTYAFDKLFGWSGLLVELVPRSYDKLRRNRQANTNNVIVNAAVCDKRHTIHYFDSTEDSVGATSGIVEYTSEVFQTRWWPQLKPDLSNTVAIECLPLQEIVEEHFGDEPQHFDFFSLDVEGSEVEVLQSIDFSKISFGILFAEANAKIPEKNPMIKSIMEKNGYIFMEEWERSYWFKHPEFDHIYEGIL